MMGLLLGRPPVLREYLIRPAAVDFFIVGCGSLDHILMAQ